MEQNLNHYRIFYYVAKSGNISHAANMLFISQPAISKAISKLEEDLKTILFVRNSRGVTLTEQGQVLFQHLELAFLNIELGEEKLKRINSLGIGSLKIGASSTLCKYILLPYLKEFVKEYPHIKITIESQSTAQTIKLLENNKLDIALVIKPDKSSKINYIHISDYQDIFVSTRTYLDNLHLREESAFKTKKEYENDLFEHASLMLLDKGNVSRQYIDNYLNENAIITKNVLEVNNMDLLIDFAKIGLGIACVIKEFVQTDLDLGVIEEINLSRPIKKRSAGFAYQKGEIQNEALKCFIDFVKKYPI